MLPDRWTSKIDFTGSCWLWMGAAQSRGYGSLAVNGRTYLAHRAVYEMVYGPIGQGLTLDHLCSVKTCVNPEHLEPVPAAENTRRKYTYQVTCLRGHALAGDNLRVNARGHRSCKTCMNTRRRENRRAKAVA